jgi:hypothetical protein
MRQAFVVDAPRHAALRALNYEPAVERLRRPRRGRTSKPLRDLVADLGSGYATVFARLDCARVHGVELLSQSDMFAAEPEGRVIRVDSMQRPERHLVRKWDVLIAGAGTLAPTELYGRALIADDRLVGKYVGQDTLRIEFQDPDGDDALFAYAYLASPTGLRAMRSTSYGTKILRIRRDILGELPVPHVDDEVRSRVARLVRDAAAMREAYLRELGAARAAIENLPHMKEAHAMCAERKARVVSWTGAMPTLSAWTYASAGGALQLLQRKWSGRLGDVLEADGVYNGPRFARVLCDPPHGVDFLSQRDAFLIRPIPRRIVHPGFADRMLFAPENTIMVGGHGTLGEGEIFGRAMLIAGAFATKAFTQDLLRVLPRVEHVAAIYAFLTTLVGMRLLRSTAVGTKILSMRLDLLRALPIPDLPPKQRTGVDHHIREALVARTAADTAESEAIRIIEEEVMPAWLA